jgi:hypothetical protein
MSRSIEIAFQIAPDDYEGIHRVRNFAEELSRSLEAEAGSGSVPMEDADRATTRLRISDIHARKVRRVMAFVRELLLKHHFEDGVVRTTATTE